MAYKIEKCCFADDSGWKYLSSLTWKPFLTIKMRKSGASSRYDNLVIGKMNVLPIMYLSCA